MNRIKNNLQAAYDLITNADTSEIDAFYLAVEEATGFLAEALDELDEMEEK